MEKRYQEYIKSDLNSERDDIGTLLFRADKDAFQGIQIFTVSSWVWPSSEKTVMEEQSHAHDFDEIITLFGSDPENPKDLCGEVEFWIEDEQFSLTQSSVIYIPKGVVHCPLIFHKVHRPIFHYIVGQAEKVSRRPSGGND